MKRGQAFTVHSECLKQIVMNRDLQKQLTDSDKPSKAVLYEAADGQDQEYQKNDIAFFEREEKLDIE